MSNHDELMSNFFSQPDALVLYFIFKKQIIIIYRLLAVILMTLTATSLAIVLALVFCLIPLTPTVVANFLPFMNTEPLLKGSYGKSTVLINLESNWEKFLHLMSEKFSSIVKENNKIWNNMG